jgi:hypothetical protein
MPGSLFDQASHLVVHSGKTDYQTVCFNIRDMQNGGKRMLIIDKRTILPDESPQPIFCR